MLPVIAWGKLGPYLALLAALVAAWLYVSSLEGKVKSQAATIIAVQRDLEGERSARKQDVAGLTVLAKGLKAAAVDTKADQAILAETINANAPQAASPGLSAYLSQLRASDGAKPTPPARVNR